MPKVTSDQTLQSSILDRLLKPADAPVTARSEGQILSEMKTSVRRDLENLLNTRWRCVSWPPPRARERTALNKNWRADVEELNKSMVNYGVPDITGQSFGAGLDARTFADLLKWVVQTYEPRFKNVTVTPSRSGDASDRSMRFRINATLNIQPMVEAVAFDTSLEPATGQLTVERANR